MPADIAQPNAERDAVIAIVKGGLGNQLFIYAAARALALRTGRALFLDTARGYTHDDYGRSYRLDRFPIRAEAMPEAWRIAPTLKHPRHKLIRALNKLLPRDRRSYIAERHGEPATQLTALHPRPSPVTLLGYWQNEEYFSDHAETIRAELAPPAPADARNRSLGDALAAGDSVFLHVRRIRYAHLLGAEYYQAAMDAICATLRQPRFVLFGDDLDWLVKHLDFHGAPVEAITHNAGDELADLWLMSRCRHAVVANSSFSWWGAWLGDVQPDRLIFAPQHPGWPIAMPPRWRRAANLPSQEKGPLR
jgi:hypothetical protein